MKQLRSTSWILLAGLLVLFALPVAAQDGSDNIIASNLNNPRHLYYAEDGTLYIAEAGLGGENQIETEAGPVAYGNTARLLALPAGGGEPEVVVDNLVSAVAFNNYVGVNSVLVEPERIWLVLGQAPAIEGERVNGVLVLGSDLSEERFIDFAALEEANNPDNDFDVAANPIDIAVSEDGTYYVLDASANALYSLTADGEPEVFLAWEDLPVPSGIDIGPEGDLYVSFLSAFPFETGSARIERWTAEGELVETYGGLTGVTDVLVADDGTIYAVEMSTRFGDLGWEPDAGRVVIVSADGVAPVAEGLNFPYGIAMGPDGMLAVSVNAAFVEPGTGSVIVIDPAAAGDVEPAPVAPELPAETPEPSM